MITWHKPLAVHTSWAGTICSRCSGAVLLIGREWRHLFRYGADR